MRQQYLLLLLLFAGSLGACKKFLDRGPTSSITPDEAFSSSADLQIYVNSFYNTMLPTGPNVDESDNPTSLPNLWGGLADNMAGTKPSQYLYGTVLATNTSDYWSWTNLRNVNYFLQNYNNPAISQTDRNNYSGIAHFFRAWFYYNMVKLYGNVPWYSKALDPSDSSLYKTQDPRTLVMDSVMADLNYACQNITATKDASCTTISKWVAYALKARVCLFEGTFRKYHTELSLPNATTWLQAAAGAADTLIASGQYHMHTTGSRTSDYRSLFISTTPSSDEIMLAQTYSSALNHYHDFNWWYTSPTYGSRLSYTKSFINTYLNADGSRFTDVPGYDTLVFWNEVKNRDPRLFQTIRMAPYTQSGTPAPPDFNYTYTGYQPLKFAIDNAANNQVAQNQNAITIFRYAEVLLNDAEAYAELGQMTPTLWSGTIGALRARAGITNTALPTTLDAYLQAGYYPDVTDPVIMEIRRERGVELTLEGFRYDDIRRWKEGPDLAKTYDGFYVPAMNTVMDLNQDGKPDVSFVSSVPANKVAGVIYVVIDNNTYSLSNGTYGNLIWEANQQKEWDDYKYFFPISTSEIQLNPNLKQNTGW
jgi:hypothetical protein